ncbi:MAG: hypothetical protein HY865_22600 [Chloroflexi bacterium]|nr:hypothetical protein [Chloroflexota bacterium]
MFTKTELQNLIAIVSTHPTPEGVGSPEGQVKVQLISKLSRMVVGFDKTEKIKEVK